MRAFRSSLVLILFVCLSMSAAEVAPGVHASGEILVSVRNPDAVPIAPLSEIGWTVTRLNTVAAYDETSTAADTPQEKTWFLFTPSGAEAARSTKEHPWDIAHRHASKNEMSELLSHLGAAGVVEIEPVVAYEMRGFRERFLKKTLKEESRTPTCAAAPTGTVVACAPASFQWPNVQHAAWHQDDDHTQLRKARDRAASSFANPATRVRIAHLDTGYYPTNDSITPQNFNFDWSRSFIPNDQCGDKGIDCYQGGLPNGHGPETLSVLAGGDVNFTGGNGYPAYTDYVGGAPLAEVFTYRVSSSVVLLWPLHVGQGIFSAIDRGADVISMSMGGAPSYFLRDAVNAAYDHGTPMFFAAADFFRLPIPLIPIEIPPHTMVYPARFSTATPVSGMTASGRGYGLNPSPFWSVFRGQMSDWMMRGSYGPTKLMKDRALTANSPNITARYGTAAFQPNQIKFSFSGTSAATPQAAASAALWLQMHRAEFDEREWRSWVKTQSAYDALTKTASLPSRHGAVDQFGAGLIQANEALDMRRPSNPVKRPPGKIGVDWITLLASILGAGPNEPKNMSDEEAQIHRSMLQLEVAQLLTTEPKLRAIVNGDFESTPTPAQLRRLSRALRRHPRASEYLKKAVAAKAQNSAGS